MSAEAEAAAEEAAEAAERMRQESAADDDGTTSGCTGHDAGWKTLSARWWEPALP